MGFYCFDTRHNQVRDLEAGMLAEVCNDIVVEPKLTPLTGEKFIHKSANTFEEARLDDSALSSWVMEYNGQNLLRCQNFPPKLSHK